MTAVWDPQADFSDVVDGLQAVTLRGRQGGATPVSAALGRHLSKREAAASEGRYTRHDVVWHLPSSEVPQSPEIGATITDSTGRSWTVLRVDEDTRSSRWRCWSRLSRLVQQLNDRVEIQRATWSKDDHGGLRASWRTWRTNIAARVQPVEGRLASVKDRRVLETVHHIYLSERVALDEDHRIVHCPGGEIFRVLGFDAPERLDELMTVRAVRMGEF